MYKKLVGALYVINIVMQSVFTLLIPAGLMFFFAWLLVNKCSAPSWIYAIFISAGMLVGFYSMVKFAIHASEGLERLEKQQKDENTDNNENK